MEQNHPTEKEEQIAYTRQTTIREEKWRRERKQSLEVRQQLKDGRGNYKELIARFQRVVTEIDKLNGQWDLASEGLLEDIELLSDLYIYLPMNVDIESDRDMDEALFGILRAKQRAWGVEDYNAQIAHKHLR